MLNRFTNIIGFKVRHVLVLIIFISPLHVPEKIAWVILLLKLPPPIKIVECSHIFDGSLYDITLKKLENTWGFAFLANKEKLNSRFSVYVVHLTNKPHSSPVMSFHHIRSREHAKYETILTS